MLAELFNLCLRGQLLLVPWPLSLSFLPQVTSFQNTGENGRTFETKISMGEELIQFSFSLILKFLVVQQTIKF
jgi:hypothetical protein